jgi:hypothetical protein
MLIRLTRKFSEAIDGIDLSHRAVGDRFDLSSHDAALLIAEGWAAAVAPQARRMRSQRGGPFVTTEASDRVIRRDIDQPLLGAQERRRAEDRIREELRDSRSKTLAKNHGG